VGTLVTSNIIGNNYYGNVSICANNIPCYCQDGVSSLTGYCIQTPNFVNPVLCANFLQATPQINGAGVILQYKSSNPGLGDDFLMIECNPNMTHNYFVVSQNASWTVVQWILGCPMESPPPPQTNPQPSPPSPIPTGLFQGLVIGGIATIVVILIIGIIIIASMLRRRASYDAVG